jgi:thiol-disulfide isomerase/thioredoxin
MHRTFLATLAIALSTAMPALAQVPPPGETNPLDIDPLHERVIEPRPGVWRATLLSPGGQLPFGLRIERTGEGYDAAIINGPETIPIPHVHVSLGQITFDIPHYDSSIVADIAPDGRTLLGRWTKRTGEDAWALMDFKAVQSEQGLPRFVPVNGLDRIWNTSFPTRWRMKFDSSDDDAVAVFNVADDNTVTGTIMTTTGDYRYLAGDITRGELRLSTFDGAHAFLFGANLQNDGSLKGDFWSRDSWHETWTAVPDPDARLPDAFGQVAWTGDADLADLAFPDLEGTLRTLDDPAFAGKARIIEVFGSWCPNCHDHADFMAELDRMYRERGLSIVGLAFEVAADFERNVEQVRRFTDRHNVAYPILIAGLSDKAKATQTLRVLDRVKSYPTTIFMDQSGTVRAIYSGYSGPATGDAHTKLREDFIRIIEDLLND